MSTTYLVHRQLGQSFLYRSIIPRDLRPILGQNQFQLSLRCGIFSQAKYLSQQLYHHTQAIYAQIRHNSDQLELTLQQIKHQLRVELNKRISIQIGTLHDITDLKTVMAPVDTLDDT